MKKRIIIIAFLIGFLVSGAFYNIMGVLQYPLDNSDKEILRKAVRDILPDLIFDAVWDDYFYYSGTFDSSIEGWNAAAGGTGTIVFIGGLATMSTGNVSGDSAGLDKSTNSDLLDWTKRSRFRIDAIPSQVTAQTIILIVGRDINGPNFTSHYGFKITDATLYGITGDATDNAQTVVTLKTGLTAGAILRLEAWLLPNEKVVFYVNGEMVGVSTTNIPHTDNDLTAATNPEVFMFDITTNAAASKNMILNFFEFIEKK